VTTWEPQTYLRYADLRFRAGLDLMARIPQADYKAVYDLGCGTGHLTQILAERFPNAQITGVDSSAEMLAEARGQFTKLSWVQADIRSWKPEAVPDLIFSNAALQWVSNHEALFPALLRLLKAGGVLAVQMPRHFESPSHVELKTLVRESRWRARLGPLLLTEVPSPETYWNWLSAHSSDLDIWETIYLQVLQGKDPVVDFMRGTALRPFLTVLSKKEGEEFLAEFSTRMAAAYPPEASGETLFPFRRIFMVARR
jgi:trans-aconitate 2-methyltransferase